MFDAKPGLFILSIDVLWLKYLFFTSFRLSVYSLQRVDYNESDARFTITYTVYTYIHIRYTHTYTVYTYNYIYGIPYM